MSKPLVSDKLWALIAPLLPPEPPLGKELILHYWNKLNSVSDVDFVGG